MTKTTGQKALELINAVREARGFPRRSYFNRDDTSCKDEVICRLIEREDDLRKKVSDTIKEILDHLEKGYAYKLIEDRCCHLILPEPNPIDPLVAALCDAWPQYNKRLDDCKEEAAKIRAAMRERGYEWRKIEEKG